MTEVADYYLDITKEICPLTFVRTKLLIERLRPGQTAEIRLKGSEPLENVPRSIEEMGHAVLAIEPEADGPGPDKVYRLRLRKNPPR
ncbi:MAG: sulfurtransferase TusA family protein [Proteobacteria bacterium]|nr:sulfurtransferase TusA family protein [Pseudomonadota bacterium]